MRAPQIDGIVEELAANGATEGVVEFEEFLLVEGDGGGVAFVKKAQNFEGLVLDDGLLLLVGHFLYYY